MQKTKVTSSSDSKTYVDRREKGVSDDNVEMMSEEKLYFDANSGSTTSTSSKSFINTDISGSSVSEINLPAPLQIEVADFSCSMERGIEPTCTDPIRGLCSFAVKSPHPEKVDKGGEDACFVQNKCLGVFDGVGGWNAEGIDPGLYSGSLSRLTEEFTLTHGAQYVVPGLKWATMRSEEVGSSTACVAGIVGSCLHGVNIGDSLMCVIRREKIVFMSECLQHGFNFPYQLGTNSDDRVEEGAMFRVELEAGDIIVCASDGMWDNMYEDQILGVVRRARDKYDGASLVDGACRRCCMMNETARQLARTAKNNADDGEWYSPFARRAREAGLGENHGGKMDDVTVVVSIVMG